MLKVIAITVFAFVTTFGQVGKTSAKHVFCGGSDNPGACL